MAPKKKVQKGEKAPPLPFNEEEADTVDDIVPLETNYDKAPAPPSKDKIEDVKRGKEEAEDGMLEVRLEGMGSLRFPPWIKVLEVEEEAKEKEPPPEQWTMTPLKLEKDGLTRKGCCGKKDIVAQDVHMTIGDQVFTANQDVRGTTKKRQWTFTSEGKGGEDKLVYKEFMPAPGICCGCCEQRNIMMVWKGDKPSGKPSGILALPPKGERKQGVKMNVLDAEGNVIYSIRDPPISKAPKPPREPCYFPMELRCCGSSGRCCGTNGCNISKTCTGPEVGIGCGHLCSQRIAPDGCIGEVMGGHPCMKIFRTTKELHLICCLTGASVYNRGEDQATCRFRSCAFYDLWGESWCKPMAPLEVGFPDYKDGRFKLSLGFGPECEADLGLPDDLFGTPKAQLVCCCFEASYTAEDGFGYTKICRPLGEMGCCNDLSKRKDNFSIFGCALGCCGIWCDQCICPKACPGAGAKWCRRCPKCCAEPKFEKEDMEPGYWHTPLGSTWQEVSKVQGIGVTHTSGATPAVCSASASFNDKDSQKDLLAFSTVMIWETLSWGAETNTLITRYSESPLQVKMY